MVYMDTKMSSSKEVNEMTTPQELYAHYEKVVALAQHKLDKTLQKQLLEANIELDIQMQLAHLIVAIEQHNDLTEHERLILIEAKQELQYEDMQIDWDGLKSEYQWDEKKISALTALQAGLDIAGLEPTIGAFADGANALIYSLRAAKSALTGEGKQAKEHLIDGAISAISLIPFADVIKLVKLRKVPKLAKAGIKWARHLKAYAKTKKTARASETFDI